MVATILKELIFNYILTVDEAIWLDKFINLDTVTKGTDYASRLELLKKNLSNEKTKNELRNKYDDLYIASIMNKIRISENNGFEAVLIDEDFDEEEDDDIEYDENMDDEETDYFLSKGLLEALKIADENITRKGVNTLLTEYVDFIEQRFPKAFNGPNKRELVKAKSLFIEEYLAVPYFYKLSPKAQNIINNVIEKSSPILIKTAIEKEKNSIPIICEEFKNWINANKIKPNKQNLKSFLNEKGLKISNPNQDQIIEFSKNK